MNRKTKKMKLMILVCFFVFSFSFANSAKAGAWGEALVAERLGQIMAQLYNKIWHIMTGAAKKAAAEVITTSVNNFMTQSGLGGPLFIQNWGDELVFKPIEKAELVMNDFFSSLTSGRAEPYDYVPGVAYSGCPSGAKCVEGANISREGIVKGDSLVDIGNNYYMFMRKTAENSLKESIPETNAYEYCQDPMNPITGNNSNPLKCLSATSGQTFELSLKSQEKYFSEVAKQQRIAEIQAIAYNGFRAVESGGYVITPGSTVSDILSQAQNLGNLIIASADSPEQVITAVVTGITERAVKSGIGQAQQMVQREINQSIGKAAKEVRKANDPRTYFDMKY